ncbi:MAG: PadR family transcriptional regulator [Deltaproteobacteria bacterium]|nr:PadR family transcriptional regulator [Deltaproteobacteria bacterium]
MQLRKGVLDMVILNILRDGALYGLEMVQRLEEVPDLTISEGTIYPLLSRLRADGLVFTEWVESDQGRPRKYYSLSKNGIELLEKINGAWGSFTKSINNLIDKNGGGI